MARTSRFSARWAALLIVSVMLASLIPAMSEVCHRAPLGATALQSEDSGAISAFVTDEVGRPIADAQVIVLNTNYTNETDETGFAFIDYLPADPTGTEYLVYANKSGYVSSELVEVTLMPWGDEEITLVIRGASCTASSRTP